jgi:hypothetical protein
VVSPSGEERHVEAGVEEPTDYRLTVTSSGVAYLRGADTARVIGPGGSVTRQLVNVSHIAAGPTSSEAYIDRPYKSRKDRGKYGRISDGNLSGSVEEVAAHDQPGDIIAAVGHSVTSNWNTLANSLDQQTRWQPRRPDSPSVLAPDDAVRSQGPELGLWGSAGTSCPRGCIADPASGSSRRV